MSKKFLASVGVAAMTIGLAVPATANTLYFQQNPNYMPSGQRQLFVFGVAGATGTVTNPAGFSQGFTLGADGFAVIDVGTTYELLDGTVQNNGFKVESNAALSGYYLNRMNATTDMTYLIDGGSLGTNYFAVAYQNILPDQVSVQATADNTVVTFRPPGATEFQVTLNAGQTYMLTAMSNLTGTQVTATAPVAVFSGNQCTNVPTGNVACDHIVEQVPSVDKLSTTYLLGQTPRTGTQGNVYRAVATENGTQITQNGSVVATLNQGEYYEGRVAAGGVELVASKPILVAEYLIGTAQAGDLTDPAMTIVPGSDQWLKSYVFAAPAGSADFPTDFVSIVIRTTDLSTLRLDGSAPDVSGFQTLGSTLFSYGNIDVSLKVGAFTIEAASPFQLLLSGFAQADSYFTYGGAGFSPGASDGPPPTPVIPDIDTAVSAYTTDQLAANQVNPNFVGGTLQLSAAATIATNFTIQTQGGTIDTMGYISEFSGVFSGPGGLAVEGGGTLILSGANTYEGGTYLRLATLITRNNDALGTGTLTIDQGGKLRFVDTGLILANNITIVDTSPLVNLANIDTVDNIVVTLSGTIDGAGSLNKTGSGTLVLTGANSYAGGTNLNEGAITITNGRALGTGTLTMANGTTLNAGANGLVVANNITLNSSGTINTGANTLTLAGTIGNGTGIGLVGQWRVDQGPSWSGSPPDGPLAYTGQEAAALLFGGQPADYSISTAGTDVGQINYKAWYSIIGYGSAELAQDYVSKYLGAYYGPTEGFGTDAGQPASAYVRDNANGPGFTNYAFGMVTLPSTLVKTGTGTLILQGANSYSGGTQLNGGTIQVENNRALGTGALTMADGTTLVAGLNNLNLANNVVTLGAGTVDTGASAFTLSGVVSGAGSITKTGSGTLVLTGANSYTGGTVLREGAITVGNNLALGTGTLAMKTGTVLKPGTSGLVVANAISLGASGTVDTGANDFTLSGTISNGTALALGYVGKWRVDDGPNYGLADRVYTGQEAAAMLFGGAPSQYQISTAGTDPAAINRKAWVSVYDAGCLGACGLQAPDDSGQSTNGLYRSHGDQSAYITDYAVGPQFTNYAFALVEGPANSVLVKTGTGTLTLSGANSYSGGTNLTAGAIRVGNNAALGTGALTMAGGTTLVAGTNNLALANAIVNQGVGTINTDANRLTLNGVISGAGSLTKIGSGTLVLNGANSYSGGTALNAGTIRVGSDSALGTGTLAMKGITTLQAGAANLNLANKILFLDDPTIDVAGNQLTVSGVISGVGPLLVIDSAGVPTAALVLAGSNSYTGGTVVTATTLQISQDANLGNASGGLNLVSATLRTTATLATARAVALGGAGASVDVATGTSFTLNGVVSGTTLFKIGSGTLVLNGANSYGGGTGLNAGTITVNTNTALGSGTLTMAGGTTLNAGTSGLTTTNAIVTLGNATINSGASPAVYTLTGEISGAGGITKQGTGMLTLSGASSYTGATTVAAGTLNVTGSLVSAVTVNSGAALTGTGTVGALSVLAGGSVNPGAPGTTNTATLTVTGAASLAGTYTANITPSSNDRITAGGALTLGGALVVVPTVPASFGTFNQVFTVASGSTRTGTFATTTGLDQFGIAFAPVVEYTATQANIRLAPQSLVVLGNRFGGISGNELEVAQAFDRAVAGGYNPQAFFNVYANAGSSLPRTLREMSGEQRATERRVVLDSSRVVRESALDRLNLGLASLAGEQVSQKDGDRSLTFWLRGAGSWGKAQTSGAATGFRTAQYGLLTGIDWSKDGLTVGGMFNYLTTDVTFSYLGGSSRVETVGGSVYAGYRKDGGLVLNAGASIAGARTSGARAITLPSFAQTLQGVTRGTTYQVFGELAWDLAKDANTQIEPFVRNAYVGLDMNALTETGGVAALTAVKQSHHINVFNAGMRFVRTVDDGKFTLNASAAWQRTSGGRDANTFLGIPAVGQLGNIRSVAMDANSLLLQAGVGAKLSDKIRFNVDYSGLIGGNNTDHAARATLDFAF